MLKILDMNSKKTNLQTNLWKKYLNSKILKKLKKKTIDFWNKISIKNFQINAMLKIGRKKEK